jgi:serine-type D-Ala-D-Ala carboxypeptidase/endopeptidase
MTRYVLTMGWAAERAQAVFDALNGAFEGDGIMVAVTALDASGPAFLGSAGLAEDARFEIGSITKTMTATLLASLVGDAVVALDDEIGRWLDAGPNADITLEQLATHTSGLPRLAPNQPTEETNPYRDFTAQSAEEGLRAATRTPAAGHLYSNFGYQLLGLVLERASGQRYEDLLAERLLEPLAMSCSGTGAAGGGTRLTGHDGGRRTAHWDFALPGPGAVETSVSDLARYLSACLAPPAGPLGTAIRLCEQPRVRMGGGSAGGLAWIITSGGLLFHNGGTGGFSASVAIDQAAGHAVGALVNTSGKSVSLLDAAVITAVSGGDPRSARPQGFGAAPGPQWTQRAREMAQALLDGKFTEIHQNLVSEGQARLSADRLGQMWQFALQRIGDPGPVSVSCRSLADGSTVPGEVAALITFAGSKQQLRLFVVFTASGQIAILRVLAADEVAPW